AAISFGVGEARVNDAEQGLIEVARRIRRELGCCVRYVHHSGKANAHEKMLDQYAGRGGSTMADGACMVAVLQPLSGEEWAKLAGVPLLDGETGMVLARPKLSLQPASAGHSHQSEGLCVLAHDPDNAHDGGRAGGELRSNPLDQLLPWNVGAKVFDEQRQRRSR